MTKLRTHYDNLQVTRTASPEVIRAAYKGLVQKWHPDRNPPERREECTRVVTLLNRAYEVLSDPARRAAHDRWIAEQEGAKVDRNAEQTPGKSTLSSNTLSETDFRSVTVRLADLPGPVREDLISAAKRARPGYLSAATNTVWSGIVAVAIAIVALLVIGLFAGNDRWSDDGHWWALGFAFALLYWGASGALLLNTLLREKLAHKVLVTPTHLIETDAATARIWPLLGIRRFQMTVHTRNGSHTGSTIHFEHACGDATTFSIGRKAEADALHATAVNLLARLDSTLAEYLLALQQSPLFRLATRIPVSTRRRPWEGAVRAVAIAAGLAVVIHWGVLLPINANAPTYRGPPPSRTTQPARAASSAHVEMLPPRQTSANEFLAAEPMPFTGWIQPPIGNMVAPLRIHAEAGTNYFMKLTNAGGGTVATMFLRAGETLDVAVPIGTYRIRFAYGSRWYGDSALFGPDTRYSELEGNMIFHISGSRVAGAEITLTKQAQGNLRDHRIRPDEF